MKSIMEKPFQINHGILTNAKQFSSPHHDARPDINDISLLVIHYISLPPNEFGGHFIEDFFMGQLDSTAHPYFEHIANIRVSAHLLINRQGEITQFVNFNQRAWHAGVSSFEGKEKCNDYAIGIELEGSNDQPFTKAQYRSLISVTQSIQQSYPQITQERIVGHCDISPGRKINPGQYFDWEYYKNELNTKDV